MTRWIEDGDPASPIWLVGEAPGEREVESGHPFSGPSGFLLNEMLREAGLDRSQCFATNVCHVRPPSYLKNGKLIHNDISQWFYSPTTGRKAGAVSVGGRYVAPPIAEGIAHLHELLQSHAPVLILLLGNTPLWAVAGETGITKWRGSTLDTPHGKAIPTFHPADVLRAWTHRPIVVQDLRRAERESHFREVRRPAWEFVVEPSIEEINAWFAAYAHNSETPLVCDTEGWGRVDCIGFAADSTHAICIPFTHPTRPEAPSYWSAEDEFVVTQTCRTVLSSRPITFHNAIWDCQVIARCWALLPRLHSDTQVAQHVAFPGLLGGKIDPVTGKVDKKGSSLSLSFIASMYCDYYRFWKDDGRNFDPNVGDAATYWRYNCEDCVRTAECAEVLSDVIDHAGLRDQFEFEMLLFAPVLSMMFRGLRYDMKACRAAQKFFGKIVRKQGVITEWTPGAITEVQEWLNVATGCGDFNPDSTPQMRALFHDDLCLPPIKNRKTGAVSLDDTALSTHARRTPLIAPLVTQIQNYRTLDTLRGSLDARPSEDGRMRHAFNIAFVETFRFSSNETAFGEGGNLQNIKRPDGG
jgi:DNA polymerase